MECMVVNVMYQFAWVTRCSDMWLNIISEQMCSCF